jgi:hypothetical protein
MTVHKLHRLSEGLLFACLLMSWFCRELPKSAEICVAGCAQVRVRSSPYMLIVSFLGCQQLNHARLGAFAAAARALSFGLIGCLRPHTLLKAVCMRHVLWYATTSRSLTEIMLLRLTCVELSQFRAFCAIVQICCSRARPGSVLIRYHVRRVLLVGSLHERGRTSTTY